MGPERRDKNRDPAISRQAFGDKKPLEVPVKIVGWVEMRIHDSYLDLEEMGHKRSSWESFSGSTSCSFPPWLCVLGQRIGSGRPQSLDWASFYRSLSKMVRLQISKSSLHIQPSAPSFTQAFPSLDFKVRKFKLVSSHPYQVSTCKFWCQTRTNVNQAKIH